MLFAAVSAIPLMVPIRGQGFSTRPSNFFRDFRPFKVPQTNDKCLQCGEFGHWRRFRYNTSAQQTEATAAKKSQNDK